jgi:hypothetical protein
MTAVPGKYQCAEILSTAFGRGKEAPIAAHAFVYALREIAFNGFPCPKNMAGIRGAVFMI